MQHPRAIILYRGGACGDILKSLCHSQLTGFVPIVNERGRAVVSSRFRDTGLWSRIYQIESCHDYKHLEAWPDSRRFWISVPEWAIGCTVYTLWYKTGIYHIDQMRRDFKPWLEEIEKAAGPISDTKQLWEVMADDTRYINRHMAEMASVNNFEVIDFLDILDVTSCTAICERLLGHALIDRDAFAAGHDRWVKMNSYLFDRLAYAKANLAFNDPGET